MGGASVADAASNQVVEPPCLRRFRPNSVRNHGRPSSAEIPSTSPARLLIVAPIQVPPGSSPSIASVYQGRQRDLAAAVRRRPVHVPVNDAAADNPPDPAPRRSSDGSGPGLSNVAQHVEIDLGVKSSSGQILVAKNLADSDQPCTITQQFAGQSMQQTMWANLRRSGSLAGPLDDIADQIGPDRSARRPAG